MRFRVVGTLGREVLDICRSLSLARQARTSMRIKPFGGFSKNSEGSVESAEFLGVYFLEISSGRPSPKGSVFRLSLHQSSSTVIRLSTPPLEIHPNTKEKNGKGEGYLEYISSLREDSLAYHCGIPENSLEFFPRTYSDIFSPRCLGNFS